MELTVADEKLISELLSDKKMFDAYVYTPIQEAVNELKIREYDMKISEQLALLPKKNIPFSLEGKKKIILCRNIATPNYEMQRFVMCADVYKDLDPIILEYTRDKFADINDLKFALGRMCFYKGVDKNHSPIIEYKSVLDTHKANGKEITSVRTYWGQSLKDFHHEFLFRFFPEIEKYVNNTSDWFQELGGEARNYYEGYLSLFLKHGILCETFLLNRKEFEFNKNIVLPAIINIEKKTGKRPLIVTLEPAHTEWEKFWESYPAHTIDFVVAKLNTIEKESK